MAIHRAAQAPSPPALIVRNRDEALPIHASVYPTPFGNCLLAETGNSLCHLSFIDDESDPAPRILHHWPNANIEVRGTTDTNAFRISAFQNLSICLSGTPFQIDVWKALLTIPHGTTTSYSQIAVTAGHPTAIRAVASAIGKNPIAIFIPCHRVIPANGSLGNYRWGKNRKRAILDWEEASEASGADTSLPLPWPHDGPCMQMT